MNTTRMTIKAKKFGVRLSSFRQAKSIPLEFIARLTRIPLQELEKVERGESWLSLPQVELLSMKMGLQPAQLIAGEPIQQQEPVESSFVNKFVELRDRMIGLLLRKTRIEQEKTVESIAAICEISTEQLEQFETGKKPIPLPLLEILCDTYHIDLASFLSNHSPFENEPPSQSPVLTQTGEIPAEIADFSQNPANLPYLELAKRLSELDAAKLRAIAEGILEITY